MQELQELRPAPRRTSSAVLWLMAAVVIGGSGLLWVMPGDPTPTTLAAAAPQRPSNATEPWSSAASMPRPEPAPTLSSLHVP
jgi:hypothetical protein